MWKFARVHSLTQPELSVGAGILISILGILVGVALAQGPVAKGATLAHPIEWDGHRWSEFSAEQKEAFLGGFLAGAAASQAYAELLGDTVFDAEALAERLATLRSDRSLYFAYALNLYHARLHDYYFYIDRRDRPIYRAITELNFQLQTKHY